MSSRITQSTRWFVLRLARIALCAAFLASCAQPTTHDQPVMLSLTNTGVAPLRCLLRFGHWVDRDLGEITPAGSVAVAMTQAATDGALYVMRNDGQRKMMIETIQCALPDRWMETVGQLDFATVRTMRARSIQASCAAPAAGTGRVACATDRIEQE